MRKGTTVVAVEYGVVERGSWWGVPQLKLMGSCPSTDSAFSTDNTGQNARRTEQIASGALSHVKKNCTFCHDTLHMFLYSYIYILFLLLYLFYFKESSTEYSERLLLDGGRVLVTECDLAECDLAECDLAECDLVECGLAEHGIVENTTSANLTHTIYTYTLNRVSLYTLSGR